MMKNNKTLYINEKKIELEHSLRKVIEYANKIVVLMYDDTITPNNVICFDKQGIELWRIDDVLNIKKPTGNVNIIKENEDVLLIYSTLGLVFKIDIEKKKLIGKSFLR